MRDFIHVVVYNLSVGTEGLQGPPNSDVLHCDILTPAYNPFTMLQVKNNVCETMSANSAAEIFFEAFQSRSP